MSREINFVRERRRTINKQEVADRQVMHMAAAGFGCVVALFFLSFGVNFYIHSQLRQVMDEQTRVKQNIVANQEIERSFITFVRKLSVANSLYQTRLEKKNALDYFSKIFGQNVFITNVNFDQSEKLLIFRVQSQDVFSLKQIITIVNSKDTLQRFASVAVSDLMRNSDGTYQVDVVVSTQKAKAT